MIPEICHRPSSMSAWESSSPPMTSSSMGRPRRSSMTWPRASEPGSIRPWRRATCVSFGSRRRKRAGPEAWSSMIEPTAASGQLPPDGPGTRPGAPDRGERDGTTEQDPAKAQGSRLGTSVWGTWCPGARAVCLGPPGGERRRGHCQPHPSINHSGSAPHLPGLNAVPRSSYPRQHLPERLRRTTEGRSVATCPTRSCPACPAWARDLLCRARSALPQAPTAWRSPPPSA
jgi:hypothetical protein